MHVVRVEEVHSNSLPFMKAAVIHSASLCRLSDLPFSFSNLPIVDLFLSENEFVHVPKAIVGMRQLTKLSMACCQLKSVSTAQMPLKILLLLLHTHLKLCLQLWDQAAKHEGKCVYRGARHVAMWSQFQEV